MAKWEPAHRPGGPVLLSDRIVKIGLPILAVMVSLGVVRRGAEVWGPGLLPTVAPLGGIALWWAAAWRHSKMGVAVGSDGVLLRRFLRSRVVPWQDIASVEVRHSKRPGLPHELALWIICRSGEAIETPVLRLKLRIFSLPIDFGGSFCPVAPDEFDQLVARLRTRLDGVAASNTWRTGG